MTDTLTLGPVLDLIERFLDTCDNCGGTGLIGGKLDCGWCSELRRAVPICRALCEQHAAQLRVYADGQSVTMEHTLKAAAEFLSVKCAPRRELEQG